MPELRWTLLIVGAVFIIGLALWELRRQRQAPRQSTGAGAPGGGDRVAPTLEGMAEASRVHREPIITLPELHPEPRVEARAEPRFSARGREPAQDLPVVEVDDASFSQLRVEGETGESDASGDADVEPISPSSEELATAPRAAERDAHDENTVAMTAEDTESVAQDRTPAAAERHPEGASADGAPVVDWPGEASRKIIALRLVSAPAARFQGRAVRQALAAEGFVLGKFDIFHKAGPDERAVLSAASLTKPGTFAMNTIDAQRFGGISLFAVLPGPLPPQATFDALLTTARSLNDRLQGALQDERGEPLTPMRSASIRQSLSEGNGSNGQGHREGQKEGHADGQRDGESSGTQQAETRQ